MTDIPKLKIHLVENPRKAFRFTFTKTAIPAPAAPVDEASVKIVEAHQQRALAEARIRALAEAQEPTEAEPQKLPEPPPLSAEEIRENQWNFIRAQNALRLDLEDRQKREELALQQEQLNWEQSMIDAEKKFIDEMHQRMGTRRPVPPVPQPPQVPHDTPVAQVAQVKPTRTRTFNKCV